MPELREVHDYYDGPGVEWALRSVGPHLHPGSEDATVALAEHASHLIPPAGAIILDIGSALGGPARYLARRFAASVVCLDGDLRMHEAAAPVARREGLDLRLWPVLGRTERIPLRSASVDVAWSQDAMCHMDKAAVVAEVARVLKPGGHFVFSDWIAKGGFSDEDATTLARLWAFPSLWTLERYAEALGRAGFDVLLVEDRTAKLPTAPEEPLDQAVWDARFALRWGASELERQRAPLHAWRGMLRAGRTGFGAFVAKQRA
jgi:SAM-dependent methyltransferase